MKRSCTVCGREYPAKLATSRYCSGACRAKASTLRRRGVDLDARTAPQQGSTAPPGVLVATLTRELDATDKRSTYNGQLALVLARRLEASDNDTGSAVAALSKELDRLTGLLFADVKPEPDMLDGLVADVIDMQTRARRRQGSRRGDRG